MSKELFISSTPHETKVAIVEDEQLTEIYFERENEYTLAGSIYKGKVTRVLPGMQSAFVDIGLERDAFLYVSDFLEVDEHEDQEIEQAISRSSQQSREDRGGREDRPSRDNRDRDRDREPRSEGRESRRQQPSQRDLSRTSSGDSGATVIEADFTTETPEPGTPRLAGDVIPDTATDGDGGARRYLGRRGRRPRDGGERESRDERPRSESRSEYGARDEREERTDRRGSAESKPFVLPGESLQKYGGEPAAEAVSSKRKPVAAPHAKPSTEVDLSQFVSFDGYLLPGEKLSKYVAPDTPPAHLIHSAEPANEPGGPAGEFSGSAIDANATPDVPTEDGEGNPLTGPESAASEDVHAHTAEAVAISGTRLEQETETQDAEPQDGASASVKTDPDIAHFVVRRRAPRAPRKKAAAAVAVEEENGSTDEVAAGDAEVATAIEQAAPANNGTDVAVIDQEAQSEIAQNEAAQEGVLPSEYAPSTPAPENQDSRVDAHENTNAAASDELSAQSVAVTDVATAPEVPAQDNDGATPHHFGHGDLEEVEEELQEESEFDGIGAAEFAEDEFAFEELEEETLSEATDSLVPAGAMTAVASDTVEEIEEEQKPDLSGVFSEADFTGESDEDTEEASADGNTSAPERTRERRGRQRRRLVRGGGSSRKNVQKSSLPTISELLKEGQEILVQIAKEPIAKKGARITSHIALPGRFLVFMPTVSHVGVSRKIGNDEERMRLKRILLSEKGDVHGGFIVRTAAAGASEEDLRADIRFLINLWQEIKNRSDNSKSPSLIYHDLNLVERVLRDQVTNSFSSIWVDSEVEYERIVRFLSRFQPALVKRVKLYTKELPLYEQFGIQEEINKALKSKVWLKSGGYIVINQTEALVAIDINTGKYVGKTTRLEDTIVKTNIDAIQEIVRQIRLRDLGGIIVIDFIDMDERKNRQKVMQALEEALKQDRAPSKVLQFNDFGLVAITRKRVKQSLERTLGSTCNYCQGTGFVKSVTTVCNEIYVELRKMAKHLERHDVMLRVNPEVVKALKTNNARWLQEMEELTRKTIIVKSDPTLHQEQFDIN